MIHDNLEFFYFWLNCWPWISMFTYEKHGRLLRFADYRVTDLREFTVNKQNMKINKPHKKCIKKSLWKYYSQSN